MKRGRLKVVDRKLKHTRKLMQIENPGKRNTRRGGKMARRYKARPDRELYQSKQWQKMRQFVLASHPACNICKIQVATQVDHIRPHKCDPDLFFNLSNCQSICKKCHQEKTAAERRKAAFYDSGQASG